MPAFLIVEYDEDVLVFRAFDALLRRVRTRTMVRKGRRLQRFGGPKPGVAAAWQRDVSHWLSGYDVMLSPVVATIAGPAGALNGRR